MPPRAGRGRIRGPAQSGSTSASRRAPAARAYSAGDDPICRKAESGTPKCLATCVGFTPARSAAWTTLRFASVISGLFRPRRLLGSSDALGADPAKADAASRIARSRSGEGLALLWPAVLRCTSRTRSLRSRASSPSEMWDSRGAGLDEPDADRADPVRRRADGGAAPKRSSVSGEK